MQVENNNDVIDVKQLLGILLSYKWLIAFITFLFCVIAVVYCLFRTPVYLSSVLLKTSSADQEKIIVSRLILENVVKDLHLNTQIVPSSGSDNSVDISEYDVGTYWQDKALTLVAKGSGQYELTYDGEVLLRGGVGKVLVYQYGHPGKYIRLKIASLNAKIGSKISLTQHHVSQSVNQLEKRLKTQTLYKKGDILKLSLSGKDREELMLILNKVANEFLSYEYMLASKESAKELNYLMALQPGIERKLHETVNNLNVFTEGADLSDLLDPFIMTQSIQLGKHQAELLKLNSKKTFIINNNQENIQRLASIDQVIEATQQQIYLLEQELSYKGRVAKLIELVAEREKQSMLNSYILTLLNQEESILKSTERNISILSSANYPQTPINKSAKLILVLAFILGLFLSIAFVFVWEYLIKGIKDPQIISLILKSNLFGLVYKAKKQKVNSQSGEMEIFQEDVNGDIECYRQLRENILSALKGKKHSIVTLTGIQKNIGNTYISRTLARVLAASGKNVLLLDSNFHNIDDNEKTENEKQTFVQLLKEQVFSDFQVIKTNVNGLDYIPAGLLPDNDSEILFSSDLSIIKSLADKYHVVIIDNLPLNHNVNALKLMEISDLNLLTLGYAKHNEDQLSILMDRLGLSNINLTGFILNNVSKNDYYGKKYKY